MEMRMLTIESYSSIVIFVVFHCSLSKLQSFEMPSEMNTATFHPTAREFVCGGLDFRIYKYNFETGVELGKFIELFKKLFFY